MIFLVLGLLDLLCLGVAEGLEEELSESTVEGWVGMSGCSTGPCGRG